MLGTARASARTMLPSRASLRTLATSTSISAGRKLPRPSAIAALRTYSTATPPPPQPSAKPTTEPAKELATYSGPLASTFTRLKLFSLASLGLASTLTPVLLLAPGELSFAGRVGLSITALATSGVSTGLIAWIGTPYVGTMRLLSPKEQKREVVMELNTVSWRLKPQRTLLYEPSFIRPTSRPFATWEITNTPPPPSKSQGEGEKVVAETFDVKSGRSLGKWKVKYEQQADGGVKGKMVVEGKPIRYFNVHEELLDDSWQVLG